MADGILYVGNTNVVELRALTNSISDAVDTGATVEVTILDSSGTAVSGQVWPATAVHDEGGTYHATLNHDIAITAGERYTAQVEVTGTGGERALWNCTLTAMRRECA